MAGLSVLKLVSASLAIASAASAQILAPMNDILFPSSGSATDPLEYSGANSPYYAGPNVFGISRDVPEGCTVQQASYIVRHGSRFPDSGAYNSWVAIQQRIQAAKAAGTLTASGSLSFIPNWNTALSNPTLQLSQESMTGFKEAHDLGYQLRARYPSFYQDGKPYMVWANAYATPVNTSRVVQTARAFLQGYLYVYADTYGTVVSVNSTGSVHALGDSLGPSDICPAFTNNAQNNVTNFYTTWAPAAVARVNALVTGITFTQADILFFPYLCGYESQILGRLSPWCGVFTDEELKAYSYAQSLSYFYGVGPGSTGPAQKVFLPYLDELMALLMEGPGQQGVGPTGASYTVPNLIMSFLNDNQIAELTAALGIFGPDGLLPIDHVPSKYLYNIQNFITMRGTVAFEVLNCLPSAPKPTSTAPLPTSTYTSTSSQGTSSGTSSGTSAQATSTGSTSSGPGSIATSTVLTSGTTSTASGSGIGNLSSTATTPGGGVSSTSATGTGIVTVTVTATSVVSDCATATPARRFKRDAGAANSTYIRIVLNDAVYPVQACQDGPGNSCLLSTYAASIHQANTAAGSFSTFCNVTAAGYPTTVNGASFYTNLTLDYLAFLKPDGSVRV